MNSKKILIFILRVSMGWILFYAGLSKILDPQWSSAGFLANAKSLPQLYDWLATPGILSVVDFLNQWGVLLLGAALILGIFVRIAGVLGAVLMLLYYIPGFDFPYAGANSYIVDQHVVFALILLYLAVIRAGRFWGLERGRY